jgi:hypothetical protein
MLFFRKTVTAKRQRTSEMRAKYPELYKVFQGRCNTLKNIKSCRNALKKVYDKIKA